MLACRQRQLVTYALDEDADQNEALRFHAGQNVRLLRRQALRLLPRVWLCDVSITFMMSLFQVRLSILQLPA